MKIISKFTDFYDSVGKKFSGIPGQQVWIREETEVSDRALRECILLELGLPSNALNSSRMWSKQKELLIEPIILGVAGNCVPLVRVQRRDNLKVLEDFFYSFKSFTSDDSIHLSGWKLAQIYDLFSKSNLDIPMSVWNEIQTPLFLLKSDSYVYIPQKLPRLILNPLLKDFKFFKFKDAFSTYQELDQFLSRITIPEEKHPQVSDSVRLEKHGFDKRYGFRKRKF